MSKQNQADVVIVGAGIWGLSTAYHLAAAGQQRVVVIERGRDIAAETTRQAAGQIGQLRTNPVLVRAVQYTLELMGRFQETTGHDPHFTQTGSLQIALTPQRLELFQRQVEAAESLQIDVAFVSADEISRLVPALDQEKVLGAIFLPNDGYVEAHQCALAYAAAARDLGVEIRIDCSLIGLRQDSSKVLGIETSDGAIECDTTVITVGPWARHVLSRAGFSLPMQPIRLQQARTAGLDEIPAHHPVVRIPDESCYLRPEKSGYLFGLFDTDPQSIDLAKMPTGFSTTDIRPERTLIVDARRRLAPVFPILEGIPIDEYRQGMVGCTPDGHYVLGPVRGTKGLWVATGCGGMGIAGSAAVGRWLANWISEGNPGDNLSEFEPDRFGQRAEKDDWVREKSEQTFRDYYALPTAK